MHDLEVRGRFGEEADLGGPRPIGGQVGSGLRHADALTARLHMGDRPLVEVGAAFGDLAGVVAASGDVVPRLAGIGRESASPGPTLQSVVSAV